MPFIYVRKMMREESLNSTIRIILEIPYEFAHRSDAYKMIAVMAISTFDSIERAI